MLNRKSIIIIAWLVLWQLVSRWVDNSILLVGPVEVLTVLWGKLSEAGFWQSIGYSLLRILAGFFAGWLLGLLLAAVSASRRWVEEALQPPMTLIKTVPVASFVVLFLIWFRSDMLAVAVSLCVVLPNVYLNTLEGIKSTDPGLSEMARVYHIHPLDRFFYIYRPALKPFWESCLKLSVGMSWKSGVAAELIGTPDHSIGEQLYLSKVHLDTAEVLAWTAVLLMVSILCETGFVKLWRCFMEWQPSCRGIHRESKNLRSRGSIVHREKTRISTEEHCSSREQGRQVLHLHNLSKAYGEKQLFQGLEAVYNIGQTYYFETPSGSGKTTLFRMIAGLECSDSGEIRLEVPLAYAFQEDRLCESYSALKNVELVTGSREKAYRYLLPLLGREELDKPCALLSGGMKRRVAVARAFAAERELVLLDEPFAGLDQENRLRMQAYVEQMGQDKAVLVATHIRADASL